MNHTIIPGPDTVEIPLLHSAFVPCHNLWGHNSYFLRGTFDIDVLRLPATSTSGSPAVCSGGRLLGFLTNGEGRFTCDGRSVTAHVPENQRAIVIEGGAEKEQWTLYNSLTEAPSPEPVDPQPHWRLPEYVTWVEQKALAAEQGISPLDCLDEAMVRRFVERIRRMELPFGKITIDAGWQQHELPNQTDGYWEVDTTRFPNLETLCRWLEKQGFVPGLWFGLPRVGAGAPILQEHPELFSDSATAGDEETPAPRRLNYHVPSDELTAFYRNLFRPYAEMGFRKFKLDYYYGERAHMTGLIRCAHDAIRALDPTIEIECHHPDIFFSRWVDVVRANDVKIENGWDWEGLTLAHLRVCGLCAKDRIINLDHAGGNEPSVVEHDFLRHMQLFDLYSDLDTYPVVSLLPDRFSDQTAEAVRSFVQKHTVVTM